MATDIEFLGRAGTEQIVATVKNLLEGKQDKGESSPGSSAGHSIKNITVPAAGWVNNEQTVTVNGVLADPARCTIIVGPDWSSADVCEICGVDCIAQGDNSLTFQCSYVPDEDVVINATILV